jgi:PAS domain S-box-containing protein
VKWKSLSAKIKLFFAPPVFPEDGEKTRQASLLYTLLVGAMFLSVLGGSIAIPFIFIEKLRNLILITAIFGISSSAYGLMRLGKVRLASILFLFGTWPVFAIIIFFAGGMQSGAVVFFIVCAVFAGLLLGFQSGLIYCALCFLYGLGMVLLESGGYSLPRIFPMPSIVGLVDMTAALMMAAFAMHIFNRDLHAALALTRQRLKERRQAEEALRASEEKFRSLFETSRDSVFICDMSGGIKGANRAAEILLGYPVGELVKLNLRDLYPHPRELDSLLERVRTQGYVENYEAETKRRDGATIFVSVNLTLLKNKKGDAAGFQGNVKDITERKQTETNIARQMQRLSALHTIERAITSSTDLHTILDLLAREVVGQLHMDAASILLLEEPNQTLNFAASAGFRTEALQFTKLKFGDGLAGQAALKRKIVHIPDLAEYHDNPRLTGSIAGEGFTAYFGVPLITKGRLCGVMEIFHRSAFTMDSDWIAFLETLAGQATFAIDNARLLEMTQTTLKETEALLWISEGLAAISNPIQYMKDVVTLLQDSFGYSCVQIWIREQGSGNFAVRVDSGKNGMKPTSLGHRLAAEKGIVGYTAGMGIPLVADEADDLVFHNREPLLLETKLRLVVPIRSGEQVLGVMDIHQAPPATLTQRDIKLVGAAADQLGVALQKAQLYVDLQNSLLQEKEMRSQLIQSEKLAVTGRLMASVSHELNNPLQAIQNALFLLKDEKNISAQAKQDLGIVLSETDRMAALLGRLRTTYKTKPFRTVDFHPVQINTIIEDMRALLATHLRHAKITLEFNADPALPSVNGISDQLRQVILNLLMNAVDAMPSGGRLSVSTVNLTTEKEVRISVSDTGKGIDPKIHPHLFEMFFSGKENGTGLGLAICQEIVLNHNGRIRAENRPEGGATFSVWLPVPKEKMP